MDLKALSGLGAKRWYFTAATASQTELWEAGERLCLRVPLLWRHSWAEQDLLQTTTRKTVFGSTAAQAGRHQKS